MATDHGFIGHVDVDSRLYDGFLDHLSDIVKTLKNAPASYSVIQDELEDMNQRSSDLLHYIELHPNLNAADGYKVYARIAEIRRRRRQLKNELSFLEPLCAMLDNQRYIPDQLGILLGQCNNVVKDQNSFAYRVKTDELENLPGGQ